jgi:hypothetical protein
VAAVAVDRALQHKLGLGGDEQVDRPGARDGQRLEGVGDLQLVDADLDRRCRSDQHARRVADADRHIDRAQLLQKGVKVTPAHHPHGHFDRRELHAAVKVDVLAVDRMASDKDASGDIVAPVAGKVAQDRQRVQVRPGYDNLLARRCLDDAAGRALLDGPRQRGDDVSGVDAQIIGKGGLATAQIAQHAKARLAHVLEQHRRRLQRLEHGGDLIGLGDRLLDAHKPALCFQSVDVFPQRHRASFFPVSSGFRCLLPDRSGRIPGLW